MSEISLRLELKNLPKGSLVHKVIHGKTYTYLQWREGKKVYSRYLKKEEIPTIQQGFDRRKEIEEELKQEEATIIPLSTMTSHLTSLTGSLMEEDTFVARFEKGKLLWMDEKKVPLWILRTKDLTSFLESRAIDPTRPNSRLLKKALQLPSSSDLTSVLSVNGVSLTDHYWFKPKQSRLTWKKVSYQDDCYYDLSLKGSPDDFSLSPRRSPQLTVNGSYEKGWKRINGEWWLYKQGSEEERFSEYFIYLLGKSLSLPMAEYALDGEYIRTRNFAADYDFEPAEGLVGEEADESRIFDKIENTFGKEIVFSYLKLISFDRLVFNMDRHNQNYGFMRDRKTGEVISLAPNFDNNIALISRGYPHLDRRQDGLIRILKDTLEKNPTMASLFKKLRWEEVTEEKIDRCLSFCPFDVDKTFVKEFILNGVKELIRLREDI